MKWILVVVGIFNGEIVSEQAGVYDDMTDCFFAREEIIWDYFANPNGQPPVNYQVVCIPTDKY